MNSPESRYVINVAERTGRKLHCGANQYEHFFRVEITDYYQVRKVHDELRARFKAPNYKIDITHWNISGSDVDPRKLPKR